MTDYAPVYSTKERLALVLKHSVWAIPLFGSTAFLFLPWFEKFAKHAHCYQIGTINGIELLINGIFIGLPLVSAALVSFTLGPRCVKVLQLGQTPLPGEKVLRKKTKYHYGFQAKIQSYMFIGVVLALMLLGIRGIFWAEELLKSFENNYPVCEQNERNISAV